MRISIIIPCYNEDQTIKTLIKHLIEVELPINKEIIIVDDGSERCQKQYIKKEISNKYVKIMVQDLKVIHH